VIAIIIRVAVRLAHEPQTTTRVAVSTKVVGRVADLSRHVGIPEVTIVDIQIFPEHRVIKVEAIVAVINCGA